MKIMKFHEDLDLGNSFILFKSFMVKSSSS